MNKMNFLILMALFIGFTSCNKDDDDTTGKDAMTFEGSFSREFEVQGTTQRATYTIAKDKINYDLAGGFAQTNYDTAKEYYSSKHNRWIGYREDNSKYYVIFFKDASDTKITLYKKEVLSLDAGKTEPIPAADNTENYGWNIYRKNFPVSGKIKNLHAPQAGGRGKPISGEFTKFDFATGKITPSSTDWDIAFRGTSIIINGGVSSGTTDEPKRNGNAAAYVVSSTFEDISSVNNSMLAQDAADGFAIKGWYNYTGAPNHLIIPIAGKVLVIKTHNGKYAKVEILSYYKDANTDKDSRYYTFNYVYQPNDGVKIF